MLGLLPISSTFLPFGPTLKGFLYSTPSRGSFHFIFLPWIFFLTPFSLAAGCTPLSFWTRRLFRDPKEPRALPLSVLLSHWRRVLASLAPAPSAPEAAPSHLRAGHPGAGGSCACTEGAGRSGASYCFTGRPHTRQHRRSSSLGPCGVSSYKEEKKTSSSLTQW